MANEEDKVESVFARGYKVFITLSPSFKIDKAIEASICAKSVLYYDYKYPQSKDDHEGMIYNAYTNTWSWL